MPAAKASTKKFKSAILDTMDCDDVSFVARKDETIASYGVKLFDKHKSFPHRYQYIKQKMRELACFLLIARQESSDPSLSISDCLSGKMYDSVLSAVKTASGFNSTDSSFQTTSLALKLGHSLMLCSHLVLSKTVKSGDDDLKKEVKAFQTVYKSH